MSKASSIAGSSTITTTMLISAPRASSMTMARIISTLEYSATPTVAANRLRPLVMMDTTDERCAADTASRLPLPAWRWRT